MMNQIVITQYQNEDYWKEGIVEAWMPLPQPYKEAEAKGSEII